MMGRLAPQTLYSRCGTNKVGVWLRQRAKIAEWSNKVSTHLWARNKSVPERDRTPSRRT